MVIMLINLFDVGGQLIILEFSNNGYQGSVINSLYNDFLF